jgi:hypothetical protein
VKAFWLSVVAVVVVAAIAAAILSSLGMDSATVLQSPHGTVRLN